MSECKKNKMTKAHLAYICDVSPSTVRYWCNNLYLSELSELGYNRNQKVFTPRQWGWITEKLVIS